MNRLVGLFPGQGSQRVGMGREFLSSSDVAVEMFDLADRCLGFSLSDLCLNGPLEELTLTQNTQPAILVVSYICFQLSELELQAAAGHSLGEYTALLAANSISFSDAVQLVHKRGRYMQEAVPSGKGKMVAVLGPTQEEIEQVTDSLAEGVVEIANLNSPGQTVVAGDAEGIDVFSEKMGAKGAKIIPLNVSAPFHCALMKPAQEKLAKDLDAIAFTDPRFPVYANVTASSITSGEQARELLKEQVCSTVRWTESMVNLIEGEAITHSVEFGSGGVLTKLLKRINKSVSRLEVSNPESLEKTRAALD